MMKVTRISGPAIFILLLPFVLGSHGLPVKPAGEPVSLVVDSRLNSPARHGLTQLLSALESNGIDVDQSDSLQEAGNDRIIVIGYSSGSEAVRDLARTADLTLPSDAESLLVHQVRSNGRNILLICGADDRGLMYAALDLAEQIRLNVGATDPLAQIENISEKPEVQTRSVARMLMNRGVVEKYFYSEQYWEKYLNMLAKNRYNNFTLMFGYGAAGYFEPPYPFMFDIAEFPEVRVIGMSREEQQRNVRMLKKIIQKTHSRGLDFTVALWTHIFVPGHNNYLGDGFEAKAGFPTGLTQKNLIPYTKVALERFLKEFPGIDRIEFRVHVESSVNLPHQRNFWREVFEVIEQTRPELPIDMRAKGFTDDLIQLSVESPLQVRLTTKHWGEELGLPFHPTEDSLANKYKRRHTYADLLEYPKRYDMLWRLWSHGTVKVLLWGSPEHARRFVESTHVYDGDGFEIHEPLAMKMGYKRALHDVEPYEILSEEYRFYDWEFERYWHYYQVFGRMGYNPDTPSRVWEDVFRNRFGEKAAPYVQKAYASASQVLPRIVAYATRNLSAGYSWPEKRRWEDLPVYVNVRPSDTAQFLGVAEAARFHLAGKSSPKIWPQQNSQWFEDISRQIRHDVKQAEKNIASARSKEFMSTAVDMRVLAYLAAYHSRRLHAGLNYSFFEQTGDLTALDKAIEFESQAIDEWRKIVDLTRGVYPENIIMGRPPDMEGNWATELEKLEEGLADLKKRRAQFVPEHRQVVTRIDFGDGPAEEGFIRVGSEDRYSLSRGGHGWHHAYLLHAPKPSDRPVKKERYRDFVLGPEPDEYAYSAFGIDVPSGYYELNFSMTDASEEPRSHGPMWIEVEGKYTTEWFEIPAGELVERKLEVQVVDDRLDVIFNSTTDGTWIVNSLVVTRVGPAIGHVPVRKTSGNSDLDIEATVGGPDPVESVNLVYTNAAERSEISMSPAGRLRYRGTIPRSDLTDGMSYFIEAVDRSGRRVTFPHEGFDHPIRVSVTTDESAPVVQHDKVTRWEPGRPLTITATARDSSGVKAVYVRYRGVNQHQEFERLRMVPTGRENEYQATIPGKHLRSRWDFMYYLEAVDHYANGAIYPDLDEETPYVIVKLHEGDRTPSDGR